MISAFAVLPVRLRNECGRVISIPHCNSLSLRCAPARVEPGCGRLHKPRPGTMDVRQASAAYESNRASRRLDGLPHSSLLRSAEPRSCKAAEDGAFMFLSRGILCTTKAAPRGGGGAIRDPAADNMDASPDASDAACRNDAGTRCGGP